MNNLGSETALVEARADESAPLPCTAELADCTCPEFCERDHDND